MLAYIVDSLIIFAAFAIIFQPSFRDYWVSDVIFHTNDIWQYLMALLYDTILVGIWATTGGKRLCNLYILRVDGSRVGIGRALARHLASYLSLIILGIGFLMIAFREDKRGLHDLICDTVVVSRR